MRLNILSDHDWESRVDRVLHRISDLGYHEFFSERDYGDEVFGISIVLVCRDPDLNFKKRVRFVKKEKKLYTDVMLSLAEMVAADMAGRARIVIDQLLHEIPETVKKYNFKQFDGDSFINDFRSWFSDAADKLT